MGVYEQFREPPASFRGKPFWSWNGKLEKDELIRQIHIFKQMGFGGFFMHARTGLITEYLGEEWFELINACADEAEMLGMEAWLYDEDRWPSGTAGGLVTAEPVFRQKFIRLRVVAPSDFGWSPEVIAAFACRIDGLEYRACRKLQEGRNHKFRDGESVLVFTLEEQAKENFYNGHTYLDTMNPAAVERFLALTHEKYKAHAGDRLGKSIKGVFTDEPHRGALMDGFSLQNDEAHWLCPWTDALFGRFKDKYGYDLLPLLPELFLRPEGQTVSQVKWHYVDLIQELFIESYAIVTKKWCQENKIMLTGHILHEDSLSAQTAMVGSVMRFYEHMDCPGVDVLTEGNENYWVVKQLASAARQTGREMLLSELYGGTGWQTTFSSYKAMGNWQALLGINLRCPHLSWYTMGGEAKRDYPASISFQSGWWEDYEAVETYFSRLGVALSQGERECELLVLHPVESVWCQVYPGWSRYLEATSPAVRELEERFRQTFRLLSGAQIDFDYGDEEMISRLCTVRSDERGRAILQFGNADYRCVLITGMTTIRSSTLQVLDAFRAAGGHIIVAGEAPAYVDAIPSEAANRLAGICVQVAYDRDALISAVNRSVTPYITVRDAATGMPAEDIFVQVRKETHTRYIVLMNMNRREWRRNIEIRLNGDEDDAVEEWFCETGEKGEIRPNSSGADVTFKMDFPPAGEHLYVIRKHGARQSDRSESLPPILRYDRRPCTEYRGSYPFELNESNVCMLDRVSYSLHNGSWSRPMEVLKADRAIRDELGIAYRSGDMIQPWYRQKYAVAESKAEPKDVKLKYSFCVTEAPAGPVYLAIEQPEMKHTEINGKTLDMAHSNLWWIDPCFVRIPLREGQLMTGRNEIEISVPLHAGTDLEAIYLLGDFGVYLDGPMPMLAKLPDRLQVGDITTQGLPFYGGTVTYRFETDAMRRVREELERHSGREEQTVLQLDAAAATVRVRTGKEERRLAWEAFEAVVAPCDDLEVDLVLTRRNTFGPLHQYPLHAEAYGPNNWLTEGEQFTESYVLLPAGLNSPPRFALRKPHGTDGLL